jgi:hypothetical protein
MPLKRTDDQPTIHDSGRWEYFESEMSGLRLR